jgi:soluble P-type ATPase
VAVGQGKEEPPLGQAVLPVQVIAEGHETVRLLEEAQVIVLMA